MQTQDAILAFAQSEKIKAGLIWISQALAMSKGLDEHERRGAERVVNAMIGMIEHEIQLAKKLTGDASWEQILRNVDQALVMIRSGVGSESVVHFTQALSGVTNIGQRSMAFLKEVDLL